MPESLSNYLWLGIAAFFGVLARAARWTTKDGKFSWRKCLVDCAAAPCFGILAGGAGAYLNPAMDPMILGAIAGLLGLLGPAAVETIAIKWFNAKIGSA